MEEEENLHLRAGSLSTCTRSRVCVSAYFTQVLYAGTLRR
jgi:hypothetical protein